MAISAISYVLSATAVSKEKYEKAEEPYIYAVNSVQTTVTSGSLALVISGYSYNELRDRIIKCESGWNPTACNRTFGCSGGMGLWQFIVGTWNGTIDRMEKDGVYFPERCHEHITLPMSVERTEAVFNYECNYLAGSYLLLKDGSRHWGFDGATWGSWKCWH
jgi:hypothetical protein